MTLENLKDSRFMIVTVVYLSLFLDNVLLTVVVPIIPDYLCSITENSTSSLSGKDDDENGRIGFLLSSKAFVQLIFNPAVGSLTGITGYAMPLFLGNLCLLLAALLFTFGRTYEFLFLARSIHGISSACIGVSGMSLVASQYSEDNERSKIMGFVLGSIALGVLVGYPIGSILYDIEGKMAPFLLVSLMILIPIGLQLFAFDLQPKTKPEKVENPTSWKNLVCQGKILIIAGAIWSSTSPMAILEPCLPIWLRTHIKPKLKYFNGFSFFLLFTYTQNHEACNAIEPNDSKKWQLGTVFIPDSVGYLMGTNFFGVTAYRYGRVRTGILAMCLIGVSLVVLPSATTMSQLIIPHLGMGLGIGIADAALVPLLASFVDQNGNYGPVYSIQQVAVSLAYSLGPIVGSELVRAIGFSWVMRIVGFINIAYCPLLAYLTLERRKPLANEETKEYSTIDKDITTSGYQRFYDSDGDDL